MEAIYVAGADPELMLVDTKGGLVSAIGRVPGTKKRPYPVQRGSIQRDNVMAEFNIDPANNSEEFEENIRTVLQQLAERVLPCRLLPQASANFPERILRSREATRFGCDPDYDAWTLGMNQVPADASRKPFRSAGGHLHIGKKAQTAEMLDNPFGKIAVVQMLDAFVGLTSILLDTDPTSPARRQLYGKAGAHRPKAYGVEYRALGNFWLRSPALAQLTYELADVAVQTALQKNAPAVLKLLGAENIQSAINDSRPQEAFKLLADLVVAGFLPNALAERVFSANPLDKVAEEVNLYQAWGLIL